MMNEFPIYVKPMMTALRGLSTGNSVTDRIPWTMSAPMEILPKEAMAAQDKAGYPVAGYQFNNFKCKEELPGLYVATWYCWASCD